MSSNAPIITFRPIRLDDAHLLFEWRQQPHVARWWNIAPYEANNYEDLERELRDDLELAEHESFVILLKEQPVGYLQTYNAGNASGDWWPDEDTSTAGLDFLIGEESLTGRGLGPAIVRTAVTSLFGDPQIQSVIADPHPDNVRSVRCFEKAGFVAERQLETPDGLSLLMRLRRSRWNELSF